MSIAYHIVTVLAALWVGFSAVSLLRKAAFVAEPLVEYGVPESWWTWLGLAKLAGAAGLLAGLFYPPLGVAAAVGIVLYFSGAVITIVRAKSWGHVPFPMLYMIPVIVAMGLEYAA
ncbi:DoxX family protein [Nocardia sp. ET3-3]|uniref:DoxX family protein n=1 Tax=Nocardia terrae TaxID=2675851 RepID=A0A7K1UWA1_9NOCA|nr:DoxX family protein [Nocardia terrae]MVU78654.1 DoxX family protein [Nocardia terrae]